MLIAAVILCIPLIAMLFTKQVNWSVFDFIIAGVLLFGTGILCEIVLQRVKKKEHRLAICALVLLIFLLIWIEIAVGLFGSPIAGN